MYQALVKSPVFPGALLALAALAALAASNSPLGPAYQAMLDLPMGVQIGHGAFSLSKPLLLWINELWMAVFFLLVGLEIKRELLVGELSRPGQVLLPAAAALGGMAVPAGIYALINLGDPVALRGWGVPTATDIAFALGVLALLGSRVPPALKVFLTAVAIIDDLGAIVVIALFYSADLSLVMLCGAAAGIAVLVALNRCHVDSVGPYIVVGLIVWLFVLKSGVHATLAGVVTALAIPMTDRGGGSPLERIEHALKPWVTYVVLPTFAFANAGVSLAGMGPGLLREPVALGIAVGLVVGKVTGVFGMSCLLIRLGLARLPSGSSWGQFLATCVLCGIGFTMSLFIGSLAFEAADPALGIQVKVGVLLGSLISALLGALLMRRASRR